MRQLMRDITQRQIRNLVRLFLQDLHCFETPFQNKNLQILHNNNVLRNSLYSDIGEFNILYLYCEIDFSKINGI